MHQKPSPSGETRSSPSTAFRPPTRSRREGARLPAGKSLASARTSLFARLWDRHFHRERSAPTSKTLLPLLIKVFAGFSKVDGRLDEHDIDSSLGFLRYDYPETVYSELRALYSEALEEPQDLNEMAQQLSTDLTEEEKILLGVQLYVLISRADLQKDQLVTFYLFMTNLGIASQAVDIVYQLNTSEIDEASLPRTEAATHPLESLILAREQPADVVFETPTDGYRLAAFRFQNLVLLKNIGTETLIARGRQLHEGEFCRLYEGQRVLLSEFVLDYQDLVFYFNAKKNVSSTQLYLAFSTSGKPFIERSLTKQSLLEIKFGLGITVRGIRDTHATINGTRLVKGTSLKVTLQDKIIFRNKTEIAFSELRRRARELGGKFDLLPTKSEYLVSNNPNLLRKGDILLSPGASGEVLLRIRCNYARKTGELEVLASDRPIYVRQYPVRYRSTLADGDTIGIGDSQFLLCDFGERIIEEQRNIIRTLQVSELHHSFGSLGETALEGVNFAAQRGDMICVMGPSGCGKSTLLRTLAGQLRPTRGEVLLDENSLYDSLPNYTPYISFIPQEDAFDPLLTVQENIDFASALRAPHFAASERKRRADAKLVELGLNERRHRLSGDPATKNLSGGERKRLNIGMDMMGISDVYIFDEPTSGLSSKDSEHLMEIIRGLAHNKIIFVSIHQPSAKLFQVFDKVLLLDHGGKMAFFGKPGEIYDYFEAAHSEESVRSAPGAPAPRDDLSHRQPDFIFDVLETPLRDLGGDVIFEEDAHGHLVPARRFSPEFWRDRFAAHRLIEEFSEARLGEQPPEDGGPAGPPQRPHRDVKDEWTHLSTLIKRSFLSKLRNRANLATTLLEAPLLAVLVSVVLRYSEDGAYNFASAFHIPTYLFLTLVIGMFLGLTNSADEIIRERVLLQRERNHGVRAAYYVFSKVFTLGFFGLAQCIIYLVIGNAILSIRDMFFLNLFWMFLTLMIGVVIGLLTSTLVSSAKTALNVIPLILIPNIILGGALIKYEEMNRNFDIIYYAKRWFKPADREADDARNSQLQVPYICNFMPLRWSYESIIIAHAHLNPISSFQDDLKTRVQALASRPVLLPEEEQQLRQAKEALAVTFGLQGRNHRHIRDQLRKIRVRLGDGTFDAAAFYPVEGAACSAENLYLNQKILDLANVAEAERTDYRHAPDILGEEVILPSSELKKVFPNVFFGTLKSFGAPRVAASPDGTHRVRGVIAFDTLLVNTAVMGFFALTGLIAVHTVLRRQLTKV